MIRITAAVFLLFLAANTSRLTFAQDDIFQSAVRTSEPLSPAEELLQLKVPDGFEVTLFASEPDLQKPLNMAFDAAGRLWVTGSNQYPYPAADGEGTDTIRILEDTDGDGTADKVTVFADDLNVPIGIYPYRDCAIVFSIPNILFLRDTDGDGRADTREVLYGPFDTSRDTHGMNNSFRRGFDGWLYCCHGFNNQSTVSGTDGHQVTLSSGNTYRIRLDGSRIEHFTHGQVNPFGMAIDANGDLFNSDCHTKPVSLLMRDGYYESFGKPSDGLGFVPAVMDHLHGSTAIDGLCQYQGHTFPTDYHEDIFVGNVMTCRVHRNSIIRTGSSIRMQEETDFLTSADPWFRPVDIQIGPDGAMYIADFYNRIIGHYEVPLDHPGRDRHRGRIWRVQYTGADSAVPSAQTNLTTAAPPELITALNDVRPPIRQHAADQIVDRVGPDAHELLHKTLPDSLLGDQNATPQILWSLQRLGQLTGSDLQDCYRTGNLRTRVHVMRICSELPQQDAVTSLIRNGLRDPAPLVQRAAADAAARHPAVELFKEVVNAIVVAPGNDVHLHHGLKIALRNQLIDQDVANWFMTEPQPATPVVKVSEILNGLRCDHAPQLALSLLTSNALDESAGRDVLRYASQNVSQKSIEQTTAVARQLPSAEASLKMEVWTTISEQLRVQNLTAPQVFVDWSTELGEDIFQSINLDDLNWGRYELHQQPAASWGIEPRQASANAPTKTPFISSLPAGERAVGVLRSRPFVAPFSMTLELCGHLGPPDKVAVPENRVVLRDFETGAELQSVFPPRSDIATKVTWNLIGGLGTKVYLEVIDGIDLPSYAWLAIGRVTPKVVGTTEYDATQSSALLGAVLKFLQTQQRAGIALNEIDVARVHEIAEAQQVDGEVRAMATALLFGHRQKPHLQGIADLFVSAETPRSVHKAIIEYVRPPQDDVPTPKPADGDSAEELTLLQNIFSVINQPLRSRLAASLSGNRTAAALLLQCVESGVPSAEILRDERLVQQLSAYGETLAGRVASLKATLPQATEDTTALTSAVLRRLKLAEGDAEAGKAVFTKHCVACHRRAGEGNLVGPQLDGIGTRGAARLLEDILHPNQNVDIAFRTSVLVLNDGRTVSGMIRDNRDPQLLDVIDTQGKSQTINQQDIEERKDSTVSLMPGNVAKLLNEDELLNLIYWLSK